MKIIIIATPRTGSTYLLEIFSKLGFDTLFEPFEFQPNFEIKDNLCLKTIIHQTPSIENNLDFYSNYIKKFDTVILLDRIDLDEHWNSYLNLAYRINNKLNTNDAWVEKSVPIDFVNNFIKNGGKDRFLKMKKDINILSKSIGVPIVYYENLFNKNKSIIKKELNKIYNLPHSKDILNTIDIGKKFKKDKLEKII